MDSDNSRENVFAELERLDLRVRLQVMQARHHYSCRDELQPFYISEDEIDTLLEGSSSSPAWSAVPLPQDLQIQAHEEFQRLSAIIDAQRARAAKQGFPLRLDRLAELFALTRFDLDTILVCLAPEVDQRYTRLYAYLQDDLSKPVPTVNMLVNLLCSSLTERVNAWQRLGPHAPLRRCQIIRLLPLAPSQEQPFSGQTLRLDERIRRYLLDEDGLDKSLDLVAELYAEPDTGPAADELLEQMLDASDTEFGSRVFYFHGPAGVGKLAAAQTLAQARNCRLLAVHGQHLVELPLETFSDLARRAIREARLQPSVLYWADFDLFLDEEQSARWQILRDLLREAAQASPLCAVLAGERVWDAGDAFGPAASPGSIRFTRVPFHMPDSTQRLKIWKACVGSEVGEAVLSQMAAQFRLSAGQIRDAAATARSLARWRDPAHGQVTLADLVTASRQHSNPKLASLAQKITPHYTWSDLVLPPEVLDQLRQLCDQVRYRSQVLEDWGFDQKLPLGKGAHALFTGQPGTGKTMAADVLAGELDLDLYKIDLSTVMSKYIGETEKNLARIFAEAATSNAILFFDEADALFGKRTEVKDAHDRYANLEISYLLQKMDEYDGLVILATNLRQNLDKAFLRRLHFIVDFPFPGAADRLRIWQGVWPADAPRASDLDLPALAKDLDVAGGSIRNIALSAAYLAASEGQAIHMAHLQRAADGEYKKIGKLPTGSTELTDRNRRSSH